MSYLALFDDFLYSRKFHLNKASPLSPPLPPSPPPTPSVGLDVQDNMTCCAVVGNQDIAIWIYLGKVQFSEMNFQCASLHWSYKKRGLNHYIQNWW